MSVLKVIAKLNDIRRALERQEQTIEGFLSSHSDHMHVILQELEGSSQFNEMLQDIVACEDGLNASLFLVRETIESIKKIETRQLG